MLDCGRRVVLSELRNLWLAGHLVARQAAPNASDTIRPGREAHAGRVSRRLMPAGAHVQLLSCLVSQGFAGVDFAALRVLDRGHLGGQSAASFAPLWAEAEREPCWHKRPSLRSLILISRRQREEQMLLASQLKDVQSWAGKGGKETAGPEAGLRTRALDSRLTSCMPCQATDKQVPSKAVLPSGQSATWCPAHARHPSRLRTWPGFASTRCGLKATQDPKSVPPF